MYKKKSTSGCFGKCLVPRTYSLPFDFINRVELLLPYKSYMKKQSKEKFVKQLHIKVDERHQIYKNEEIMRLNKLDEALNEICTATDNDEEFFKIVNGRPLYHSIPIYKSLASIFNTRFRVVQEISYKQDSALNIDINFRMEKKIHDVTQRRFFEEAKAFDKFIMEDYKKSMIILNEEENLNLQLEAKIAELQSFADESFTIMSRLLGLDYKYGLQQKYGRFLYYLSPPMWRSSNREFARSVEIEAKGFDFGNSDEEDTFAAMFEKMRKECCSSAVKPVLYFSHPHDLLDVFNGMEKQLLYHFSRGTQLVPHIKSTKDAVRTLKQKIDQDSKVITSSIKAFKSILLLCEERSIQLKEEFFKVLHGFFYEAVGTADVLKFMVHLEFCYDKVFNEQPLNMDMVTIARAIESMYMNYSKRLDAIQSGTVRRAMSRCVDLNKQKMHKAKKAAKELRLFHRLERELLKAHNLSEEDQSQSVPVKYLAKKKLKRYFLDRHVHKNSCHSLNDAEVEYLTLFTEWSKNEDPALYLHSVKINKDSEGA